jgi:NTE family protein
MPAKGDWHRTWPAPVAVGLLLVCPAAVADEPVGGPAVSERPRIGLVLSGGGAKGGAHAGVLAVLEELRVPVDCIAGTSVGAMIGGGYAAGMSGSEVLEFVHHVDWPALVSGDDHRELAPMHRKQAAAGFSHDFEVGLQQRKLVMPVGMLPSANIDDLLRRYVARASATGDFDQLPIPFRAVATDMVSGEMVVLGSGDLALAIRASMAAPGILSPVLTEEHVLADGGLVRNLPVDVARGLCADIVIAVTVLEGQVTREQLGTATQLATRAMNMMLDANTFAQQRTLTEQDIRIDIDTGDITTPDVARVLETVPLGIAAARAAAHRLAALSLSPEAYAAWRAEVSSREESRVRLAGVRYEGLSRVNPAFLATRSKLQAGDEVDVAAISREALRLSALGEFHTIEYRLEGDPDEPSLVWLPHEKPWGPHYFSADLGIYANRDEIPAFILYGRHTRTWLNALGGEWRNEAQLGIESLLSTSLYQPLDVAQLFFIEPLLGWVVRWQNLYEGGDRIATYRTIDVDGGVDFGINLGRDAEARVGYGWTYRRFDHLDRSPLLPQGSARDATLWLGFGHDNRGTQDMAGRGVKASLDYHWSHRSLGSNREWRRADLGLGMVVPLRRHWLLFALDAGTDLGTDLPLDRAYAIGGPAGFPGLRLGELRTPEYWSASASYLRRMADLSPVFDQALYAGARLQGAWFSDAYGLLDDEHVYSAAVFLRLKTLVGPLTLGTAATTSDRWTLWLAVGRDISDAAIMSRGAFH